MKKLLLFTFLLFGLMLQAQDYDFLKKAYRSDIKFTREFADVIASNFRGEYSYLDSRESKKGNVYSIIYIPKLASEETKKRIEQSIDYAYSGECKECLQVHFKVIVEGQNNDLEITGTKKYMFDIFRGKFLDLFPFWKKYIAPNDVTELVTEKGYASMRDEQNKVIFNFRRNAEGWYIQNYSDRLN
ncbi:hypothetical protein [Flavobacterium hydrophilum]|nr:hypothetical protein [Flavobacterium hydrophilum]